MYPLRWLAVLAVGVFCACDNESTVDVSENCFAACLDAAAGVDVEGQLSIAADLKDTFEHARAGLTAYTSVARALTGFVQSMVDLDPSLPSNVDYAGGGLYTVQPNADTRVELRFYLASDTSFGRAGDLIEFNLFDVSNYFAALGVKASTSISLSGISTSLGFTFDGLGRGAELLGIAPNSASPVAVDVSRFSRQLTSVIVRANVIVSRPSGGSPIAFSLAPAPLAAAAVGSGATAITFSNFAAQGLTLDQTVTLETADLAMLEAAGAYDGTLQFLSVSPSLSFKILFSYDASVNADVVFGCPEATLTVPE